MNQRWLEALGALGVLAGLVFVGLEIRQNTRALEGATVQASAELTVDLILRGMESPIIQAVWGDVASGRELDDFVGTERTQIGWYFTALLRVEENRYRQVELGTVSSDAMLDFANDYLRFRAFRQFWETSKTTGLWQYDPGFVAFLDGKIEASGAAWSGPR